MSKPYSTGLFQHEPFTPRVLGAGSPVKVHTFVTPLWTWEGPAGFHLPSIGTSRTLDTFVLFCGVMFPYFSFGILFYFHRPEDWQPLYDLRLDNKR